MRRLWAVALFAVSVAERRWDEAAGLSLDVVAYAAPQEHIAVNAAEGRGQPWTILASTCTRGKARSTSSPRGGGHRAAHPHRARALRRRARAPVPRPDADRGLDR